MVAVLVGVVLMLMAAVRVPAGDSIMAVVVGARNTVVTVLVSVVVSRIVGVIALRRRGVALQELLELGKGGTAIGQQHVDLGRVANVRGQRELLSHG